MNWLNHVLKLFEIFKKKFLNIPFNILWASFIICLIKEENLAFLFLSTAFPFLFQQAGKTFPNRNFKNTLSHFYHIIITYWRLFSDQVLVTFNIAHLPWRVPKSPTPPPKKAQKAPKSSKSTPLNFWARSRMFTMWPLTKDSSQQWMWLGSFFLAYMT